MQENSNQVTKELKTNTHRDSYKKEESSEFTSILATSRKTSSHKKSRQPASIQQIKEVVTEEDFTTPADALRNVTISLGGKF
jgi:hypothetical protein